MSRNGNSVNHHEPNIRGSQWRKLSITLKKKYRKMDHVDCAICGREIDLEAPSGHRDSLEIDHIMPISRGGPLLDVENCSPSHKRCNAGKKDIVDYVHVKVNTSRDW